MFTSKPLNKVGIQPNNGYVSRSLTTRTQSLATGVKTGVTVGDNSHETFEDHISSISHHQSLHYTLKRHTNNFIVETVWKKLHLHQSLQVPYQM